MTEREKARKRLEERFGPDPQRQAIGFYLEVISKPDALHDMDSKDAGNMLYWIAIDSCTRQSSDQYGHAAMWESHDLMTQVRHKEN